MAETRGCGTVTTSHLEEIRRRNALGENDTVIAAALGIPNRKVSHYRRSMGLPIAGINKKVYTYTIYNAKTDDILAFGSAEECTKALGLKSKVIFYQTVCRAGKRKVKKYEVLKERIDQDGDEE